MQELRRRGIPVAFFSTGGWFWGLLSANLHKNIELRLNQFRAAESTERSLALAPAFISSETPVTADREDPVNQTRELEPVIRRQENAQPQQNRSILEKPGEPICLRPDAQPDEHWEDNRQHQSFFPFDSSRDPPHLDHRPQMLEAGFSLVVHALQEQPGRRGCPLRRLVRPFFKKAGDLVRRQGVLANFDQHANHATDHLPEEVRAFDANQYQSPRLLHFDTVD
jgi:hypothetical protein